MRNWKMRHLPFCSRAAVGEIMGALVLMLVVGVSGSFLYMISLQSTSAQRQQVVEEFVKDSESAQERFKIIAVGVEDTNNIFIMVLNYGKVDIKVNDVYVDGERVTNYFTGRNDVIETLEHQEILFEPPVELGKVVEITVVSERGVRSAFVWEQ
jgi:hypothetical protein